jgi:uncharacterized surface protein with fasciclin (FAS1) repeats
MSVVAHFGNHGGSCDGHDRYTHFDGSILDYVMSNEELSTLVSLVKETGLVDAIAGLQDATLVAPVNSAFVDLAVDLKNMMLVKNILMYHVTPMLISEDNCKTDEMHMHETLLEGKMWSHSPMHIHDAIGRKSWIKTCVTCSNGTVIVAMKVLLPEKIMSSDIE